MLFRSAAPNDVPRGATVTLRSNLQNVGNAVAIGTEVVVAVHNATTGARLREWRQATALPAAATQALEEALDTSALPMGDYQARLSVYRNDQEQPLAVDTFTVREAVIAGTFQADPEQVAHGGSIELRGTVMNSGNLGVAALPLRIEVVRVDSTVTVLSLDDSAWLGKFALHPYLIFWSELDGKATAAQVPYLVDPNGQGPQPLPGSS